VGEGARKGGGVGEKDRGGQNVGLGEEKKR